MVSLWDRLFGRRQPQAQRSSAEEAIARIEAMAAPCVKIVAGDGANSWFGGSPQLRSPWPFYDGRPLTLLAQLDLKAVRASHGPDWLPSVGRLMFFYELERSTWGYDPEHSGSAVVIYETGDAGLTEPPPSLPEEFRLNRQPVIFQPGRSYPDADRAGIERRRFKPEDNRAFEEKLASFAGDEPSHRIGGYPQPIQDDRMERECQYVTNGLYMGGDHHHHGARIEALKAGIGDWRLLLQLDTDDGPPFMWGDCGRLYFWIREQDARSRDFSRAWAILQCF